MRVDRVTDDVLLGDASEHESFIGDRYVLTPKDYILLVLGARDYNYLMHENTHHMLDNECTSLYPLESHTMLQFILFMVSHKSPRMAHLLKFKKSMVDGVLSNVVKSLVTTKNRKKPLPNSITEGDFALVEDAPPVPFNAPPLSPSENAPGEPQQPHPPVLRDNGDAHAPAVFCQDTA